MFKRLLTGLGNINPEKGKIETIVDAVDAFGESLENLRQATVESILSIRKTICELVGEPLEELIKSSVSLISFIIGFTPESSLVNGSS